MILNRRKLLSRALKASVFGLAAHGIRNVSLADGVGSPRLLFVFTPCGHTPGWRKGQSAKKVVLDPTMMPLQKYQDRTTLIEGLSLGHFDYVKLNGHWGALHSLLTARKADTVKGNRPDLSEASSASFDQVMGRLIGKDCPLSAVVAGGPETSNTVGQLLLSWHDKGRAALPIHDPKLLYFLLFGTGSSETEAHTDASRNAAAWEAAVVEENLRNATSLLREAAPEERPVLEAYFSAFETMAGSIKSTREREASQRSTRTEDTTFSNMAGLTPIADIAGQMDLQSRLLAAGLAFESTRVATYVMAPSPSYMVVPGADKGHHFHSDSEEHYSKFDTFYAERMKTLLDALDSYPEGDGTVLDNTLVVQMSEISWPPQNHVHDNLPVFLFGGLPRKTLAMGQHIHFPTFGKGRGAINENPANRRIGELYLTLAEAVGHPFSGFGDDLNTRVLRELLAAR
jgi:hypothetical protein